MTPDTAALRAQIRANEDAAAFYGGTPNRIILDPATVRALCDAADEVERLRAAVVERDTRLAETIRYHDARVNRADEATDASRAAHAALAADLRALHTVKHECSPAVFLLYTDVLSLLDRHAPTTGATP